MFPPPPDPEKLVGTVRQEIFRSAAGDFAVLRVETSHGVETVAGPLPPANEGEAITAQGEWVVDKRFGKQFRARQATVAPPTGAQSIERYLASGAVAGIGPTMARRIVEKFGDATLKVLDEEPERLREVKGVGKKTLQKIEADWKESRASRENELFLTGHGVGPTTALKIIAKWGADVRKVLDEDPYVIAREIEGVGFLTADKLARALGFERDDPRRLRAGLLHVANEALANGHTAVLADELLDGAAKALGSSDRAALEQGLRAAREALELELERPDQLAGRAGSAHEGPPKDPRSGAPLAGDLVYLPPVLRAERGSAARAAALVRGGVERAVSLKVKPEEVAAVVAAAGRAQNIELTAAQEEAVRASLEAPLTIVTGGPGVGKTTVLRTLATIARERGLKLALAAPTGRAAKRLEEATGQPAKTLHRLLEWDPTSGGFAHGSEDPLAADLLVIDEASMVDIRLFHAVIRALAPGASLVMTGDVDQLPSVGPGAVLNDLIASGAARVVRLTEVFRQAARSRIVVAAHAINRGEVPELSDPTDPAGPADFFFVARDDPEKAREAIVKLVSERIPARFGFDPISQVQVLAPMRRGSCGTDALNRALKAALRGTKPVGEEGDEDAPTRLEVGDKVMQLRNDYEADVYNGDVGRVVHRDEDGSLIVGFDGREVRYKRGDATSRLALSFCATIHKSQGSEYPAVVIPVLTEHFVMLERNLLYTALTRARKLAILVGQKKAIAMAVENDRPRQRLTLLAARLRKELAEP